MHNQLMADDHWVVEKSQQGNVIRLVRQTSQIASVDDLDRSFDAIRNALVGLPLQRWGMILDMRLAKPTGDASVESAMRRNRKTLSDQFSRTAVLMKTAAGALQARRLLKQAPDPKVDVFTSEAEALAWIGEAAD